MRMWQDKSGTVYALALALTACGVPAGMAAQTPGAPSPSAQTPGGPSQPPGPVVPKSDASVTERATQSNAVTRSSGLLPSGPGVLVDQVIAVVNSDLILESDVEEDRRFQAFQPYTNPNDAFSRTNTIERLIDRTLILQQAKLQPDSDVTDAEVQTQLQALRKEIPACRQYHCETDAGWTKFVNDHGFTVAELNQRWKQRMQVLKFIEIRFRSGIDITPDQIKNYYDTKLLPEYAKRNATPPKLGVISDRIQEILLQQQVSNLLADWLKSLKAQGNVRVMAPGEGL